MFLQGFFEKLRASWSKATAKGISEDSFSKQVIERGDVFLVEVEHNYFNFERSSVKEFKSSE